MILPIIPIKKSSRLYSQEKFKPIYELKDKNFKVIWLTDEEKPSNKFCDLLINDYQIRQNLKNFIKKNNKIKLILGTYAFFSQKKFLSQILDRRKSIFFITFGGDDPKNLSLKFFNVFKNLEGKKLFIVNSKTYKALKKFNYKKRI